jgi:hypothetical protein
LRKSREKSKKNLLFDIAQFILKKHCSNYFFLLLILLKLEKNMSKRYFFTTFGLALSFVCFNPIQASADSLKKNVGYVTVDQTGLVTVDKRENSSRVLELALAPSAMPKSAATVVETTVPPKENKKAMSVQLDEAGNVSVIGDSSMQVVEEETIADSLKTDLVEEKNILSSAEPAVGSDSQMKDEAVNLKEDLDLPAQENLLDEPFISKDEPTNEVTETLENKSSYSMEHYSEDSLKDKYSDEPFYREDQEEGLLTRLFNRNNNLVDIEFGGESYYYEYKEPGLMRDEGLLNGLYSNITYRTSRNRHVKTFNDAYFDNVKGNMYRMEVRGAMGQVDYESNGTGKMNDLDYYTFEGRGLVGYDFPMARNTRLTPFLGLGWRYLKDDSGGNTSTTGARSYDRESQYFYAPVGIEAFASLTSKWDMTLNLEYDIFIDGTQKSHLGDAGEIVCDSITHECYKYDTVTNKQNHGYGARGSLKFRRMGQNFDFVIEPYIRFWEIEDSEWKPLTSQNGQILWVSADDDSLVAGGIEPHNQTTEAGLKLGINY